MLLPLPANTTSCTQILDVGINKPFKNYYEKAKDNWLIDVPEDTKVTRKLCAQWLAEAWEMVSEQSIINTGRKIGFLPLQQ
jgi:hypothetical protein